MDDELKRFVGAWRLVHSVIRTPGEEPEYPYGKEAVGCLYYHDTGVMAVQISRAPRKVPGTIAGLHKDYLAYFGRYKVDKVRAVVQHLIQGQIYLDRPEIIERHYIFDSDLLRLTPVDDPHHEIAWRRECVF